MHGNHEVEFKGIAKRVLELVHDDGSWSEATADRVTLAAAVDDNLRGPLPCPVASTP